MTEEQYEAARQGEGMAILSAAVAQMDGLPPHTLFRILNPAIRAAHSAGEVDLGLSLIVMGGFASRGEARELLHILNAAIRDAYARDAERN